jgi:tRNA(adenine34) deaminase
LKAGAVDSRMHLLKEPFWNHRIEVTSGILEHEARCLLQGFFKKKREINQAGKTR